MKIAINKKHIKKIMVYCYIQRWGREKTHTRKSFQ